MKFEEFYIADNNGKSNCVIRSLSKLYGDNYETVYNDLCKIQKELNCDSFNDIPVFEKYMSNHDTEKIESEKDTKIKDLELDNGSYIILCWDKKDFYHMVTVIDNTLYDKNDSSLDLYTINVYKQKILKK